jgi:formylglycine-generating enzyme required for sulfatase activity
MAIVFRVGLRRRLWHFALFVAATLATGATGVIWVSAGAAGTDPIAVPETVAVPAGPFVVGSDQAEREAAYRLDEAAYGHNRTRELRWYESELSRRQAETGAYAITATPITNEHYAAFIVATGHPAPDVDVNTWASYGLIHPYARTRRHAWIGGRPPEGRENHPVVLVSHADAEAYAAWLSQETDSLWRLPTELEWEKATRGRHGQWFPWGTTFDPQLLNSHDSGHFDTMPVGSFPRGVSPFGLLDAAGQVYEWTATLAGPDRYIVKGGSWDDKGCGVCRPAARHARPADLKHILIGFRLVRER